VEPEEERAAFAEEQETPAGEPNDVSGFPPEESTGPVAVDEVGPEPSEIPESVEAGDVLTESRVPVGDLAPPREPSTRSEAPTTVAPRAVAASVVIKPRVPSYLDDEDERRTYLMRAVLTAVVLIVMLIVLIWAVGELRDAFGGIFDDERVLDALEGRLRRPS
jgi:hypothetical protein